MGGLLQPILPIARLVDKNNYFTGKKYSIIIFGDISYFCVCVVDKKDKLFRNTAVWLNHKEKLFILYFLGKEKKFYL